MKKILAVSGGIDSMVMLDILYRQALAAGSDATKTLLVAHFNHGIRANSDDDCQFVRRQAECYGLRFVAESAELGEGCSEEKARKARYEFLYHLAETEDGQIYTAHHADDAIESAVINLLRGTGWRGLAPLSNSCIQRPLLEMYKSDIYRYAAEHSIAFRQDQTNTDDAYLRNRIRLAISGLPKTEQKHLKTQIYQLFQHQTKIYQEVESLLAQILAGAEKQYPKELILSLEDALAMEILRYILKLEGIQLTRPQLLRAVQAIRSFAPGKKFSLNKRSFLLIKKYYFYIVKEPI